MTFDDARKRIEDEIATLHIVAEPEQLYKPIDYTLTAGGKRIRPSLCLMACAALGGNVEKALYPALGLEIFHNFTLLHDDLMDNDEVRRGRLTVHKKWDSNTAILSGDAMQIMAYQYVAKARKRYLKETLEIFSDTALKVCEGQQYDMDFESRNDVTVEEYLTMIEYKTAVLIEGSLKIGAVLAGASHEDIELFGKFGKNLGLAFQLRDDWLDTFGDFETFGKDIGSDIVNNKKTYLLLSALQHAEGETKERLEHLIECKKVPQEDKIDEVKSIFEELGIDELTQRQAERYYKESIRAIEQLDISNKQEFISLAERMLKRSK